MFTLRKEFRFEASHQLKKHDGKCARLHGHSWRGVVEVKGELLCTAGPKSGMLIDYSTITDIVKPFVDKYLDHWHLNESTGLEDPTSEMLAAWIFIKLKPLLLGLTAVEIHETCTSSCRYEER